MTWELPTTAKESPPTSNFQKKDNRQPKLILSLHILGGESSSGGPVPLGAGPWRNLPGRVPGVRPSAPYVSANESLGDVRVSRVSPRVPYVRQMGPL